MRVYSKEWKTAISWSLDKTWDFFSRPENLQKLVGSEMKFEILSDIEGKEMYEGMLVEYNVSPFAGVKMRWCTEITRIKDLKYFIDEQRFGPYAMWHHEHHFKEIDGKVEMTDKLFYAIPFGLFGRMVNALFVSNKIDNIFEARKQYLNATTLG